MTERVFPAKKECIYCGEGLLSFNQDWSQWKEKYGLPNMYVDDYYFCGTKLPALGGPERSETCRVIEGLAKNDPLVLLAWEDDKWASLLG